ncbi:MAG: GGDEF domain-containing protein [Acetanaerobacterium sp.]
MMETLYGEFNRLHEFADPNLEQEYTRTQIASSIQYMRTLTFAMGIVYFLFIIVDYFVISAVYTLLFILVNRTLICLLAFMLYAFLARSKRYQLFYRIYSMALVLASISFFLVCFHYEHPNFLIQTMGLFAIVIFIFMVPNRWIGKILVSVIVSLCYFISSYFVYPALSMNDYAAGAVYTILILLLRAVSTYKSEEQRRLLFLNGKRLERLTRIDSMTGLYNRETLNRELEANIAACDGTDGGFSVALFDIDDFKTINDTFGHLAGDRVLLNIVNAVRCHLPDACTMFRWGGEEFIILFRGRSHEQSLEKAEQYRGLIDELLEEGLHVTCSFGVTTYEPGDSTESMLARADRNLYKAKNAGKNCVIA